jgi:hypothetical protein
MHANRENGKDPSHERHQIKQWDKGHEKESQKTSKESTRNKGNSLQQKETSKSL